MISRLRRFVHNRALKTNGMKTDWLGHDVEVVEADERADSCFAGVEHPPQVFVDLDVSARAAATGG